MRKLVAIVLVTLLSAASAPGETPATRSANVGQDVAAIKKVDREGQGHAEAKQAAKRLASALPAELTTILAGLDDANPLAENWLRGSFEAAAQAAGKDLPKADLEQFVLDRTHSSRARRLAFEWLVRADPTSQERLVPGMINDPSPELRREAVARLMDLAKKADEAKARSLYEEAFAAAVDGDQVQQLAKTLKKQGAEVDLVKHFGFVTHWTLIGPFDNRELKGFDVAYPPEKELNLKSEYDGMTGKVAWVPAEAPIDPDLLDPARVGLFDIAKLTDKHKGAATYATTDFYSKEEQPVEFRLSTDNAWKLWLNGRLVFAREEYHRGRFFDQYIVRGTLKPGKNVLLLKVLQNEQTDDWAQDWGFQFRVCDLTGKAVLSSEPRTTTQR